MRGGYFAPATEIANNCGKQGNLIAEKIYEAEGTIGYNGLTDEFTDLVKAGVIDPVLVTKSALINAASIASLLLTTACMVTDKPQPKSKNSAYGRNGWHGWNGRYGRHGWNGNDVTTPFWEEAACLFLFWRKYAHLRLPLFQLPASWRKAKKSRMTRSKNVPTVRPTRFKEALEGESVCNLKARVSISLTTPKKLSPRNDRRYHHRPKLCRS